MSEGGFLIIKRERERRRLGPSFQCKTFRRLRHVLVASSCRHRIEFHHSAQQRRRRRRRRRLHFLSHSSLSSLFCPYVAFFFSFQMNMRARQTREREKDGFLLLLVPQNLAARARIRQKDPRAFYSLRSTEFGNWNRKSKELVNVYSTQILKDAPQVDISPGLFNFWATLICA